MLHRWFSTWADMSTLRSLYLSCIRPHLEYACQLWDTYTHHDIQMLESVYKFACKVCLKQWNLDYDCMLELIDIPPCQPIESYLELTTMYYNNNNSNNNNYCK